MVDALRIADNVSRTRTRIEDACRAVGRDPAEVSLVAVTKYADIETTRVVAAQGCSDLGESRPQQLWEKAMATPPIGAAWHLIGHLQRNKVDRTLPMVSRIHSVDTWKLLQTLERSAAKQGLPPIPGLLEVNMSGDSTKHGWSRETIREVVPELGGLRHIRIDGLMTMAAASRDRKEARRNFRELRELRDQLQALAPAGIQLHHLSMGMSGDFDIAIEEGATLVRVGSALFDAAASG